MKLAVIIPGALDEEGLRLRVNHIRQFSSKNTDIIPLTFKKEPKGIKTGADVSLLSVETMELAMVSERQGADAIVLHGICDFGLEAARGAVDIPVVGLGSAAIHLARQLADSFGVVSKSDATIPEFTRRIHLMGCASRMTSMRPLNIPEATLYERNRELKKRFIEIAEFQIKTEGAQLIVAGYSAIFSVLPEGTREEMEKILGVPVIDGVAVAIRTAEMLVALSLLHSRKTYPKRDC